MDALYDLENNARIANNKKLQLNYGILKSASELKYFKPCFKHYLKDHVRSKLFKINYKDWNSAAFLPVHDFEKASASKVWQDSFNKIMKDGK